MWCIRHCGRWATFAAFSYIWKFIYRTPFWIISSQAVWFLIWRTFKETYIYSELSTDTSNDERSWILFVVPFLRGCCRVWCLCCSRCVFAPRHSLGERGQWAWPSDAGSSAMYRCPNVSSSLSSSSYCRYRVHLSSVTRFRAEQSDILRTQLLYNILYGYYLLQITFYYMQ